MFTQKAILCILYFIYVTKNEQTYQQHQGFSRRDGNYRQVCYFQETVVCLLTLMPFKFPDILIGFITLLGQLKIL